MTSSNLDVLARYGVTGSLAVGVHCLVLILLVEGAAVDATLSSSCGFMVGMVFSLNFRINRRYTFAPDGVLG